MSTRMSPRGKADAGFSLVEMLVAISILALVLAMLPGTFNLARRTWYATEVLDHQASQDRGRSFLQARLAEAMPIFEPVGSGAVRLVFAASADALSFVAPSANGPQGAGLYRFSLEVRPQGGANRNALIVAVAPYTSAWLQDKDTAVEEHVLYEDIANASFRYFGRKELGGRPAWQMEWTRRDALPHAVELSVASGRSVRVILIPLRLRSAN